MSATATQSSPSQLCELGHYTVPDEARVLLGRRIDGVVHVYDYPRDGHGRPHFARRYVAGAIEKNGTSRFRQPRHLRRLAPATLPECSRGVWCSRPRPRLRRACGWCGRSRGGRLVRAR